MLFVFNFGAGAEDLRAWHGRSDCAGNTQIKHMGGVWSLAAFQMRKTDKPPSLSVAPKFPLNPKKFNPYLPTMVV